MTFIVELFEYLMSEHDMNNFALVFKKICENADIDALSLWHVVHIIGDNKYKRCCFYSDIYSDCYKNFTLTNDISINETFIDNDIYKYYSPLLINNEKYLVIYEKKSEMNIDFVYYTRIIQLVYQYKLKMNNIDEKKLHFIMNMSHEVRTPLNAIVTMTDLISKQQHNVDKFLPIIKISSLELMDIVNNILDYSKVISNNMKIKHNPMSLVQSIRTLFMMLESEMNDKDISLSYEITDNIPEMLISDETRIKQMLLNIITNSIKYTDSGYVNLSVENTFIDENYCDILFKISDTGIGISDDKLDKIYEYFFRSSEDHMIKNDGLGVGLAIARHIITLLKGKIEIEKNGDRGTIVNITIKFNLLKTDIDKELVKDYFFNNKIIVLNIDPTTRMDYIKIFGSLKINVIIVMSIEELNEYMSHDEYVDFIIVDNNQLSNRDVLDLNTLQYHHITKILISDDNTNNIIHDYKISKPIDQDKILNVLGLIYTINRYKTTNEDNELFIGDNKHNLNTYNVNTFNHKNVKILVVEDNKQNQNCMEHILRFKNFNNIDMAEDGIEALNMMLTTEYDLILMDIKIPGIDGTKVVEKYKEQRPHSKSFIVAVTAGISDAIKQKCFDIKMDAFISKPINIESLSKVLHLMLKRIC